MSTFAESEARNADLYNEKIERFVGFEGENSNEQIVQFTINVPEQSNKRRRGKKSGTLDIEKARFRDNWLVKDIALDFRILRKKSMWYTICYEFAVKMDNIFGTLLGLNGSRTTTEKEYLGMEGQHVIFHPEHLIGFTSPPILKWFSNLCQHLYSKELASKNISMDSTLGVDELKDVPTSHTDAAQRYLQTFRNQKEHALNPFGSTYFEFGVDHLLKNTVNSLAFHFATRNNMTFSPFKAEGRRDPHNWLMHNSLGIQTLPAMVNEHNRIIGTRLREGGNRVLGFPVTSQGTPITHEPDTPGTPALVITPNLQADAPVRFTPASPTITTPSGETIVEATMAAAIFEPTTFGVQQGQHLIPIDILLDTESAVRRRGQEDDEYGPDIEPRAEKGWREHALKHLTKAGLDPSQYGIREKTPESPEEKVPETPASQMPTTPQRTPSSPSSYEQLAIHEHQHPPIDTNDIADAAAYAIDRFVLEGEEAEQTGEELEGGDFIITPAQFVNDILHDLFPEAITTYNYLDSFNRHDHEEMQPHVGVFDDLPDTPPRSETPSLHLPNLGEVLGTPTLHIPESSSTSSDRTPSTEHHPSTARVHEHSGHCNKIAEAFVEAWREAKMKVYRAHKIRHFRINQALFKDGHVCHRCYQLVRQHHEHYHTKGGHIRDHTVWRYPRARTRANKRSIPRTNKQTAKYKESKKKAKKYTKQLKRRNAQQLKRYNEQHKIKS